MVVEGEPHKLIAIHQSVPSMPAKIAVLLVSDQAMPNVLFIKQFGPFDQFVFITTEQMVRLDKARDIITALDISGVQTDYLQIDPENLNKAYLSIETLELMPAADYHVNLTCGTKMMVLAAFAFFQHYANARLYYLPINAAYFTCIQPAQEEIPITVSVSVQTYLRAYGTVIQEHTHDWRRWVDKSKDVMRALRGQLPAGHARQLIRWTRGEDNEQLSIPERQFYAGIWLEVWIADRIAGLLRLDRDAIMVGAKLNKRDSKKEHFYEYDVIFIYQNRFYTAECKYFNRHQFTYAKIREELFKYATTTRQFGINAKSLFFSANKIHDFNKEIRARCELLQLDFPADIDVINDDQQLLRFLKVQL